jgi:CBS domain-containing protein
MGENIRDVMTTEPVAMSATSSVADAARAMRDRNIGDVIVLENGRVSGIVTDRDIVVRALAAGRDLHAIGRRGLAGLREPGPPRVVGVVQRSDAPTPGR